jgi:hypothetical protein
MGEEVFAFLWFEAIDREAHGVSRSSVSTRARMNASCPSSVERFGLPCRPGSSLPLDRHSRYHAPDVDIPIENRRAASRVDRPSSIASITRFRKSTP